MKREKIAILREGLLTLTGNVNAAMILNQFIYWAECKVEADEMYAKEIAAYEREIDKVNFEPTYGWIYKSSTELAEETMLGLSPASMRKFIKQLVDKGFLLERRNPKFKWDRTMQYNVNLGYLQQELLKEGFALNGYKFEKKEDKESEIPFLENKNAQLESKNQTAKISKAIPEITTKITTQSSTNRESTKDIQKQTSLSYMANNGYVKSPEDAERQEHYFKLFWEAYPKKVNRSRARYAWESVPIDVGVYGDILRAVESYSKSRQWKDKMYVPNAENFIADRRWEDEILIEPNKSENMDDVADRLAREMGMI